VRDVGERSVAVHERVLPASHGCRCPSNTGCTSVGDRLNHAEDVFRKEKGKLSFHLRQAWEKPLTSPWASAVPDVPKEEVALDRGSPKLSRHDRQRRTAYAAQGIDGRRPESVLVLPDRVIIWKRILRSYDRPSTAAGLRPATSRRTKVDTYRRRMMARLWIVATISFLSLLFAGPAGADLSTLAAVTLCGETLAESGSAAAFVGPIGADCGNFTASGSAEARAGFVSMGTAASFLAKSTGVSNVLNQALAEARSEDILTPHGLPAGTPGFLVYTFDISGVNSSELSTDSSLPIIIGDGFAHTQLFGLARSASVFRFNDRVLTLDAAEYDHFKSQFAFDIVYGEPTTVELRMVSLARVQLDPTVPVDFAGITSFADTITLSSVDLLDGDGRPVPTASLSAASGTRYPLTGSSTPVSEPSSLLLLSTGLIGLYIGRVHRRCALRPRTPSGE
jgi:hypothetical protein